MWYYPCFHAVGLDVAPLLGARSKSRCSLGLAGTIIYNNGKMTELKTENLNSSSYSKGEQLHLWVKTSWLQSHKAVFFSYGRNLEVGNHWYKFRMSSLFKIFFILSSWFKEAIPLAIVSIFQTGGRWERKEGHLYQWSRTFPEAPSSLQFMSVSITVSQGYLEKESAKIAFFFFWLSILLFQIESGRKKGRMDIR